MLHMFIRKLQNGVQKVSVVTNTFSNMTIMLNVLYYCSACNLVGVFGLFPEGKGLTAILLQPEISKANKTNQLHFIHKRKLVHTSNKNAKLIFKQFHVTSSISLLMSHDKHSQISKTGLGFCALVLKKFQQSCTTTLCQILKKFNVPKWKYFVSHSYIWH